MKKLYALFSSCLLFASCGIGISYLGNRYSPTDKVDVFVDAGAIRKRYTVIGKGYEEQRIGYGFHTVEYLQRKTVTKAKEVGADAVLFQDYVLQQPGTAVRSTTRVDSLPGSIVSTSDVYAGPVLQTGRQILFLKYE